MAWLAAIIAMMAAAILGDLVSEEVRSRLDRLPQALLRLAALQLPLAHRADRFHEWSAELDEILTGEAARPITRLIRGSGYAFSLMARGSVEVSAELGTPSSWPRALDKGLGLIVITVGGTGVRVVLDDFAAGDWQSGWTNLGLAVALVGWGVDRAQLLDRLPGVARGTAAVAGGVAMTLSQMHFRVYDTFIDLVITALFGGVPILAGLWWLMAPRRLWRPASRMLILSVVLALAMAIEGGLFQSAWPDKGQIVALVLLVAMTVISAVPPMRLHRPDELTRTQVRATPR